MNYHYGVTHVPPTMATVEYAAEALPARAFRAAWRFMVDWLAPTLLFATGYTLMTMPFWWPQ